MRDRAPSAEKLARAPDLATQTFASAEVLRESTSIIGLVNIFDEDSYETPPIMKVNAGFSQ